MLTPEERSEISLRNIGSSDCGVIAIQAITGIKRSEAEDLAVANGYVTGIGTARGGINKALQKAGYRLEPVIATRETPATFALTHEYGKYLIYVDAHVMALVDGDLYNGEGSWHSRVEEIYAIQKGTQ